MLASVSDPYHLGGFRRGTLLRNFAYEFMQLFGSHLSELIDRAIEARDGEGQSELFRKISLHAVTALSEERLQKLLATWGYGSRREIEIENVISRRPRNVAGRVAFELGRALSPPGPDIRLDVASGGGIAAA